MKKATAFSRHAFHCNFAMEAWARAGMAVALFCFLFSSIASVVHISGTCGMHEATQECALFRHPHSHNAPGESSPHYSQVENPAHSFSCLLCFWKSVVVPVTVEADTWLEPHTFYQNLIASGAGRLISYRFFACHNRGPPGM